MGVDLGGFEMGMAEEFFELVDASAVFEIRGGKGMPQGVNGYTFPQSGAMGGFFEGFGEGVFVEMMTTDDAGFGVA